MRTNIELKTENPIPCIYGYSPKGLKGKWNQAIGGFAYSSRVWQRDIREVFPPHVICGFKEDAPVVCPATLRSGVRKNTHVEAIHVAAFDIDSGMTIDEVRQRLVGRYQCLLYSSFNHQAPFTVILIDKMTDAMRAEFSHFRFFMEGPRTKGERKSVEAALLPHVREFLLTKGDLTQADLEHLQLDLHDRVTKREKDDQGKWVAAETEYGIKALHAPALGRHKLRVVFPLATSYTGNTKDWQRGLWGLAKSLGIENVVDSKAMNLAQALYVPSCGSRRSLENAVYELLSEQGPRLDIHDFIPEPVAYSDEFEDDDVEPLSDAETIEAFKAAHNRLWRDYVSANDNTFSAAFYKTFKTSFLVRRFLKSRGTVNGEGNVLNLPCPYARFHSSTPDGAYAMNAKDTDKGFVFKCHHAHSGYGPGGRDFSTVEMIAEALRLGWFARADLLHPNNFDRAALSEDLAHVE